MPEPTDRSVLLVGSMPFEDEEASMRAALDIVGTHLRHLPDGEIGDKSERFPRGNRIAWVMYAIEELTGDPENWEVVTEARRGEDGMAVGYDANQKLRARRRPAEMPDHVQLGYDRHFERSFPIFRRLRTEGGHDSLSFQVGLPTGMAMSFAVARRLDGLATSGRSTRCSPGRSTQSSTRRATTSSSRSRCRRSCMRPTCSPPLPWACPSDRCAI